MYPVLRILKYLYSFYPVCVFCLKPLRKTMQLQQFLSMDTAQQTNWSSALGLLRTRFNQHQVLYNNGAWPNSSTKEAEAGGFRGVPDHPELHSGILTQKINRNNKHKCREDTKQLRALHCLP